MTRPSLLRAVNWSAYEASVLMVFREALVRLAARPTLPRREIYLNHELYWLARKVHHELMASSVPTIPFSILFDISNQPEVGRDADAPESRKRPDFTCVLTNPQAPDLRDAQVDYSLECKRLGLREAKWVLNENYSGRGIARFVLSEWRYAARCSSAAMIGYIQNMLPQDVLAEVNSSSLNLGFPKLEQRAAWVAGGVSTLHQDGITRWDDSVGPVILIHLWVDVTHCTFT